jgi:hypothetical protein
VTALEKDTEVAPWATVLCTSAGVDVDPPNIPLNITVTAYVLYCR